MNSQCRNCMREQNEDKFSEPWRWKAFLYTQLCETCQKNVPKKNGFVIAPIKKGFVRRLMFINRENGLFWAVVSFFITPGFFGLGAHFWGSRVPVPGASFCCFTYGIFMLAFSIALVCKHFGEA